MRKLTKEQFIEKAIEIHGNKYDYSKVNYVDAKTKVCIVCPEHGDFLQLPYNHLNGNGCPSCVRHKWDTDSFIKKAMEVHGDKYDYSKTEFKSTREKVCIICHEHGEFWQYPLSHLNGMGCGKESRGIRENCWENRKCPVCGKIFKERKKYKKICCSEECRKIYVKEHMDEINRKRSESLKETFSKKTKFDYEKAYEKKKKTCIERYGVANFSKTEMGREISRKNMTKLRRENVETIKNEILIPKYKELCENDGLELLEFRNRFDCTVMCKKCGNIFVTRTLGYLTEKDTTKRCKICNPYLVVPNKNNEIENDFSKFLEECNVKFYRNYRGIISSMEIDFYLPDYKIGFEIDGIYWHSEVYKNKMYHKEKTNKYQENGVMLIHIFEDEWCFKKEICKSRIKSILNMTETKLYARNCDIRTADKKSAIKFLEENHIQGNTVFKYAYGLYYENELVSLMTFGSLRKNLGQKSKEGHYEMLRFCNKIGHNVVGGASKLLKRFINEKSPKQIISYSDNRWSTGNLYDKLGFTLERETDPNYYYVIGNKRINRYSLRKNILVEKYGCPKEMSEHDFCISKRWYRIYDCGNKLWSINL